MSTRTGHPRAGREPADRVAAIAAIALDPLDLTALEPATQSTCLETMARLLCSLELPLQFVVRRRRLTAPAPHRQAEMAGSAGAAARPAGVPKFRHRAALRASALRWCGGKGRGAWLYLTTSCSWSQRF